MKKLLLILFFLPFIGFGQKHVPDELIGFDFTYESPKYSESGRLYRMKLFANGVVTLTYPENTITKRFSGFTTYGKWWVDLENNIIHMDGGQVSPGKGYTCTFFSKLYLNSDPLLFYEHHNTSNLKENRKTIRQFNDNVLLGYLNSYTSIRIRYYIEYKINDWQKKGEFETTVAFQERVNENSRKNMLEKYRNEAIEHFKKDAINSISHKDISLQKYNADFQLFLINISGFGSLKLPVPISEAPSFKKNFNASNYSNLDLVFKDDKFIVSHFEIDGYSYDIFGNGMYNKCIGDCQNGYGTYTAKEGTYKGHWKDGRVHGKGIFEGNEYTYDGEYINGKQHGQGKKTYPDGTIEDGTFKNGVFIGE
jgi:hypothetical protein